MADDYTDNTSTLGSLYPGGQATGTLETSRDSDWFGIALTAGKYYTFELLSTVGNSTYQVLAFHDAQGNLLGTSSGSSAGIIRYTVKTGSTGDFYVAVRDDSYAGNYAASTYTLKAGTAVTDDIGDTRGAALEVALDKKTSAVLDGPGDVDYFKIALQAGITYTITPAWQASGGGWGNLRVEDASGTTLGSFNSSNPGSFTALKAGEYYIAASAPFGQGMDYNFTVATAPDDYTASPAGAGRLTVGAAATSGKMNVENDVDWYGVQLNANATYWFTLSSSSGAYSGTGMLRVIAEDGTVVATSTNQYIDAGSSLLLQYVPAAGGKYHLEVSGNSYSTGNYAVRAELGEVDDYGNTRATAAPIAANTTIDGKLAIAEDIDVFRLSMLAGKTYLVALTARSQGGGSLVLQGEPADYSGGASLTAYGKGGVTDYRVLTAGDAGDFYFTVGGAYGRSTGTYALAISEAPADDYAADKTTTGVLAVGGSATGSLNYTGDADTFKVTLQYGTKYAFQLRGASSGEGTLPITPGVQLQIASADQQYVTLNDNADGTYTFTSTTGGDYFITVRPQTYYYGGTAPELTGSYGLHAMAVSGDTLAPTLQGYAPAANAGPLDNITLRFSEAIMRGASDGNDFITLRDSLGVTLETYYREDVRISISGDTLTINPSVQLKPGTKYLLSVPNGAVVDLAGNKLAGNDLLQIDTVGTVTVGGPGNDYLIGLGAGATLSGAGGVDTAIYGYERGNYSVIRGAASTTVAKTFWDGTTDAPDVLDGVERLMFANVNVALDIDGSAGQAYRLYRAAFDRAPDLAGIGYWIGQMDKGLSLQEVARGFLNSSEFATLYGTAPDDGTFVNRLYQNILHRTPDKAGVDYWLDVLDGGAERVNVLVAFSEGSENQAAVVQVIGNGFDYTPYG